MDLHKRVYFWLPAVVTALVHNLIHESVHYFAARLFREDVLEFRFLSNGWGTSQVIFATPPGERVGAHWLVIAWAPAVVTVLIGYVIYVNRKRWWTQWRLVNGGIWYAALFFLCLDPFYLAVLSLLFGGDVNAVAAMDWSPWPVRLVALIFFAFNAWLMVRWWREARAHPERYPVPGGV